MQTKFIVSGLFVLVLGATSALVAFNEAANKKLLEAAEKDDYPACVQALQDGADVNTKGDGGWTPLHKACQKGHTAIVKFLLLKGANVHVRDNWLGDTPLSEACKRGDTEIAGLLLDKGANINIKDNDGWPILHEVCEQGNTKMIKFLLSRGADINIKDNNGTPALSIACEKGKTHIIELLLAHGAEIPDTLTKDQTCMKLINEALKKVTPLRLFYTNPKEFTAMIEKIVATKGFAGLTNLLEPAKDYGCKEVFKKLVELRQYVRVLLGKQQWAKMSKPNAIVPGEIIAHVVSYLTGK
jgi:ankyrin repeat protein